MEVGPMEPAGFVFWSLGSESPADKGTVMLRFYFFDIYNVINIFYLLICEVM